MLAIQVQSLRIKQIIDFFSQLTKMNALSREEVFRAAVLIGSRKSSYRFSLQAAP
jgi:hypothetical protein